MTNFMFIGL